MLPGGTPYGRVPSSSMWPLRAFLVTQFQADELTSGISRKAPGLEDHLAGPVFVTNHLSAINGSMAAMTACIVGVGLDDDLELPEDAGESS